MVKKEPSCFIGFELEFLINYDDRCGLRDNISYAHTVSDSSIKEHGEYEGFEVVSDKILWPKDVSQIVDIIQTVNNYDVKINRSCGYHIHLDTTNFDYKQIAKLMMFYIVFEDVILSFLPFSRRTNSFCKLLKNRISLEDINAVRDRDQLEQLWYKIKVLTEREQARLNSYKSEKYHGSRYAGANFHSVFFRNSLEIRYHSATLNAEKIINWIALHKTIVDRVKTEENIDYNRIQTTLNSDLKRQIFWQTIGLLVDDPIRKFYDRRAKLFASNEAKLLCVV